MDDPPTLDIMADEPAPSSAEEKHWMEMWKVAKAELKAAQEELRGEVDEEVRAELMADIEGLEKRMGEWAQLLGMDEASVDGNVSSQPSTQTSRTDANSFVAESRHGASSTSGSPRRGKRDKDPRSQRQEASTRCASSAAAAGNPPSSGGSDGMLPQKRNENPQPSPTKGARRQKAKTGLERGDGGDRRGETERLGSGGEVTPRRSPTTTIAAGNGGAEPSAHRPTRLTDRPSFNNDPSGESGAGGVGGSDVPSGDDNVPPPPEDTTSASASSAAAHTATTTETAPNSNPNSAGTSGVDGSGGSAGAPPPPEDTAGGAPSGAPAGAPSEIASNANTADAAPSNNSPVGANSTGEAGKKKPALSGEQLTPWSRKDTFGKLASGENYYEADEMEAFEEAFMKETQQQFRSVTKGDGKQLRLTGGKIVSIGTADNSNASLAINLDLLSRLHWEDTTQHDGESGAHFRVFIARENNDARWKYKQTVFRAQQKMGLGVERRVFGGREFFGLYATMMPNSVHRSIIAGDRPLSSIEDLFASGEGGFAMKFEGVPAPKAVMHFQWRDMVDSADDLLIFGAKKGTARSYGGLFRFKSNSSYLHHIYRQLADEARGDVSAAHAVSSVYFQKRMAVSETERETQAKKYVGAVSKDEMTFLGPEKTEFFDEIDDTFEKALKKSMISFQDYSETIVELGAIAAFVAKCQILFPGLWLCEYCCRCMCCIESISHLRSVSLTGRSTLYAEEYPAQPPTGPRVDPGEASSSLLHHPGAGEDGRSAAADLLVAGFVLCHVRLGRQE